MRKVALPLITAYPIASINRRRNYNMFPLCKKMLTGLSAGLFAAASLAASSAAMAWEPYKPVEFIIMAGQGGGADQMARLMQSIIEKHDLSPQPFIPINKPGGSGAEALRYLQDKAGD
ncbi:MAG: hypothetical protein KDJ99_07155, partial [Candidatus Competibacteraceae bacterium]|nr:hypothetical protein [Candidatus Competibacteraceae bacterium]